MLQPANTPIAPGIARGIAAGVFERLPGAFEQQPMLRIGERRLRAAACRRSRHRTGRHRRGSARARTKLDASRTSSAKASSSSASEKRRDRDRRPSRMLAQNCSMSSAPGKPAGHADDGDRILRNASSPPAWRAAAAAARRLCCRAAARAAVASRSRVRPRSPAPDRGCLDAGRGRSRPPRARSARSTHGPPRASAKWRRDRRSWCPGRCCAAPSTRDEDLAQQCARLAVRRRPPRAARRAEAPAGGRDRSCRCGQRERIERP